MQLNPYLFFNGRCQEAFEFYAKCLRGKIVAMMPYGESPGAGQVSAEWQRKIIHARLEVGDQVLMASDAPPDHYSPAQGFSTSVTVDAAAEAERIFGTLAENGKVVMPIQETFWAIRFGMLVDRFGQPWMVSCNRPENA
jgi:PhnB protein